MFVRPAVGVAALLMIALAMLTSPARASAPAMERDATVLSSVRFAGHHHDTDNADSPDAELVGKVLGADAKAGGSWQSDQQSMSDFNVELTDAAAGRYVGMYSPRASTYSTVIRLSGAASDPSVETVAARAAAQTGTPVTVQYVDVMPMSTLEGLSDRVRAQAQSVGVRVGDVWVDESTSQIVAEVWDQSSAAQRAALAAFADSTGAPYRIVPSSDVRGSVPYGLVGTAAQVAPLPLFRAPARAS